MKNPNSEKLDFIIRNGFDHTVSELMGLLDLTYNQLYVACRNHGIRPKDSEWCQRTVNGEGPVPATKAKTPRIKGQYSNTTPYGIAGENWESVDGYD